MRNRIECRGGGSKAKRAARKLGAGVVIAGRGVGRRGVARTL